MPAVGRRGAELCPEAQPVHLRAWPDADHALCLAGWHRSAVLSGTIGDHPHSKRDRHGAVLPRQERRQGAIGINGQKDGIGRRFGLE